MPKLSIVVPVKDGAATIAEQLDAIASSADPGLDFDVVVADNGSADETRAIAASFGDRLAVRVVDASEAPGANAARNRGVRATDADWLLFCDADDVVERSWLARMAAAFRDGADLVAGPIDYTLLNPPEVRAWRGAARASTFHVNGFLPAAHTSNLGVSRRAFDAAGGFDEQFVAPAGDDIDFVWRVQLAGFPLREVDAAVVHYRLRPSLRLLWRQASVYGAAEAMLYRKFGAAGLRRRPFTTVLSDGWWLLTRLPFALSRSRRGAWVRRLGRRWGLLAGAIRYRTLWW